MKNLILRTITGIFYVALIVVCILADDPFFKYALFFIFTGLGTYEYLELYKARHSRPIEIFSYLLAFALYNLISFSALFFDYSMEIYSIIILLTLILLYTTFIFELFRKKSEKSFTNIALTFIPAIWIAIPLGMVAVFSSKVVLLLMVIIWIYDTLAYCAGSLFGKHLLFKRISPKKTWEGLIIAAILVIASANFINKIPYFSELSVSTYEWVIFAVIVVFFGTFGDLVESLLKRNFKVKDSGFILPGHGGLLDRLDSLLLAAPIALGYMLLVNL